MAFLLEMYGEYLKEDDDFPEQTGPDQKSIHRASQLPHFCTIPLIYI